MMPTLELSDEELQGFIQLCATASGPGINWILTNALLTKARVAQEKQQQAPPMEPGGYVFKGNSEDHDAKAGL